MVKKVSKQAVKEKTAKASTPTSVSVNVEITNAYEARNRLYLQTVINGKELMNFDFPKSWGENKDELLFKIKEQYVTLKANIERGKVAHRNELIGINEV